MLKTKFEEDLLIVIGISGVTCGGKTTTAQKLQNILPKTTIISQDLYFLEENDPRISWIPELNHANYDILSSLDMDKMFDDVSNFIQNDRFKRINNNFQSLNSITHDIGYIQDVLKTAKLNILIIEGFSIFNYKTLVPLCDLKYYFTLTKEECYRRRLLRIYEPPDCPGYFDKIAWPEHLQQLEEVRTTVDRVNYYSGTIDSTENILKDIFSLYMSIKKVPKLCSMETATNS
ncbi:nicotinamide riboside kinase 1 [Diorhabda sublineata]|uniref:nicotinamide riboside kinase 1 n=1 Tax=Diorhabda sublineata TaxID=1163346 RepID=UPI0024E0C373|nr:nicotinamide riboside kinase 1 [Diorhabda sublineata]